MPIGEGDVGLAAVAKALRSGGAVGEVEIAWVREGGAHEFVGARCVLPITEEGAAAGIFNLDGTDGGGNRFGLAMPDIAGVVVVAGVGVARTVGAAIEAGALLDLVVRVSLPEQARFDGGGFGSCVADRGEIPGVAVNQRRLALEPVGRGVEAGIIRGVDVGGRRELPEI